MYDQILKFWFEEIDSSQWWAKDKSFDDLITERFSRIHASASVGECFDWRATPRGRLAEIIVLDQFSRNIYRDTPMSFAADALALVLSQEAISIKADMKLDEVERNFLYMPFMHSESLKIHEVAVTLFRENGSASNLAFELKHKEIIEQFGRYPHRNAIIGRVSVPEELAFLEQPGSSF